MSHVALRSLPQAQEPEIDDISLIDESKSSYTSTSCTALISSDSAAGSKPESNHASPRTFADRVDRGLEVFGGLFVHGTLYFLDHSPFTTDGRRRLRHTILQSGPAYHLSSSHPLKSTRPNKFSGWRMGAVLILVLLTVCLTAEVVMLALALRHDANNPETNSGVLFRGSCGLVRQWTSGLAILLNFFATLMIASSNYVMQCLSAPSEQEVRRAHKNGRSLRLGISSPLNSVYMSPSKTILWWLMGMTSIPIHLLLNSAFFSSLQTNNYAFAIMTADFREPHLWSTCETPTMSGNNVSSLVKSWTNLACRMARNNSDYSLLTNEACIKRYSEPLISQYSNLILLSTFNSSDRPEAWSPKTKPENRYDGLFGYTLDNYWSTKEEAGGNSSFETKLLELDGLLGIFESRDYQEWKYDYRQFNNISNASIPAFVDYSVWMCGDNFTKPCTGDAALNNASDWRITPWGVPISGCLSRPTLNGEQCQLEYNKFILYMVIVCDLIKIAIVVLTLQVEGSPLVTIGDAVASFLRNPEPYTRDKCLMDQDRALLESSFFWFLPIDFSPVVGDGTVAEIWPTLFGPYVQAWSTPHRRWYNAASVSRWVVTIILYISVLLGGTVTLYTGFKNISDTGAGNEWTRGFVGIDPNAVFRGTSYDKLTNDQRFLLQVVLVNIPQLILSFLYYMYNGVLTAMHSAEEWGRFATHRKALRVSNPEPGQRSTYWLNLPWSYSIPLIMGSSLLHFIISRSLYLVKINVIGPDGKPQPENSISACGYSTLMILLTLVFLVLMAGMVTALSFRPLNAPMPLVGTSSLAVSAACHHPNEQESEAKKPLLWGVTRRPGVDGRPGHCSFSSGRVGYPVPGQLYS